MNDLTKKWKNIKLKPGFYYVRYKDGRHGRANLISTPNFYGFFNNCQLDDIIAEVLAKVPSYEEWQKINNICLESEALRLENSKLKELLKSCYPIIDWADGRALSYAEKKLLKQIEEVLNNVSDNN